MSSTQTQRAILLVLDSVGVGAMPDAADYNDSSNAFTLGNVASACQGLHLPNLQKMGIGNAVSVEGVPPIEEPIGAYGRLAEKAPGKDTSTGHWEMAGVIIDKPLALFPDGFPPEVIEPFVERTGRDILANYAASGTEIIAQLGEEQQRTGKWIVYTSADSVFQIAAHEETIPLEELYKACEIAREILIPYYLGRVIARPYLGTPGHYKRTDNRKDYALSPPDTTILDLLTEHDIPVTGIGKIGNIFNHRGLTESFPTHGNHNGMEKTIQLVKEDTKGLIFVNLVDFDSKYGHRNDPQGYGKALEEFDVQLGELFEHLRDDDLLIITADHGCDPTMPGTDHTREYVPLLVKHSSIPAGTNLGVRDTFSDIAQSLASYWNLNKMRHGSTFLPFVSGAN